MIFILLAVLSLPARAGEPDPQAGEVLSLPALVEEARRNNPALLAARKKAEAAEALVWAARAWKDPMVAIVREDMPQESERSTHYSIEQEIPFPGKTTAVARARLHEARRAREEYRAKEWEILSEVKIHYHKLYWLSKTAEVLRKDAEILRGIARVAQSLVSSGRASAEEALIAQTRLKQVENAVVEREEQRKIEEEDLNALLGALPGTRRGAAAAPELLDLPESPQALAERAKASSPMLLGSGHMVSRSRAALAAGRLGFAPDFKVSYEEERFRRRLNERTVGVAVTIPLWFWKQTAELKAAGRGAEEARAEADSARNEVFKELYKEHVEVRLHRRLALSYSAEILPLAEAALKIAQKNYETGRSDYARLSEAVRNLLEAQMTYYEEVYHYGEHWAMLEKIVGAEIAPIEVKP